VGWRIARELKKPVGCTGKTKVLHATLSFEGTARSCAFGVCVWRLQSLELREFAHGVASVGSEDAEGDDVDSFDNRGWWKRVK